MQETHSRSPASLVNQNKRMLRHIPAYSAKAREVEIIPRPFYPKKWISARSLHGKIQKISDFSVPSGHSFPESEKQKQHPKVHRLRCQNYRNTQKIRKSTQNEIIERKIHKKRNSDGSFKFSSSSFASFRVFREFCVRMSLSPFSILHRSASFIFRVGVRRYTEYFLQSAFLLPAHGRIWPSARKAGRKE